MGMQTVSAPIVLDTNIVLDAWVFKDPATAPTALAVTFTPVATTVAAASATATTAQPDSIFTAAKTRAMAISFMAKELVGEGGPNNRNRTCI